MDMFGDNKKTLLHMRKELYWQDVIEEGDSLIEGPLVDDDFPGERFGRWMKEQRKIHVQWALHEVWSELSKTKEGDKQPRVEEAAKRVVYRYVLSFYLKSIIACKMKIQKNKFLMVFFGLGGFMNSLVRVLWMRRDKLWESGLMWNQRTQCTLQHGLTRGSLSGSA